MKGHQTKAILLKSAYAEDDNIELSTYVSNKKPIFAE